MRWSGVLGVPQGFSISNLQFKPSLKPASLPSRETKICLKGKNAAELLELEKKAQQLDLPCYLVEDAGRTQIPAGSLTVLSIIGKVEDVNKVTGDLKLL